MDALMLTQLHASIQAGKAPGGQTWHGVEKDVFSETIMPLFSRFLMTTPGMYIHTLNVGVHLLTT